MKKVDCNCNIIKDLLPSYIEDICSEDTREFVNHHLKECADCSALARMMQKTELVSEQMDRKAVDYIKKVKQHIWKFTGFGILLGVIGIGMAMLMQRFGMVPVWFYYIVMPVFLVVLHEVLSDYPIVQQRTRWNVGIFLIEVIFIGYSVLLEFLCDYWVKSGSYPFGLEMGSMGLFISYQFRISTLIQGILFAVVMRIHLKKRVSYRCVMDGCVLGICVNFSFLSLLGRMDTLESFVRIRNQTLGIVFGEWIFVVGILSLIRKKNL